MPYYDYLCENCGKTSEIKHAWDDKGPRKCIHCGVSGKMKRLFSPTGIAFKGSGFYVTDSKSKHTSSFNDTTTSNVTKSDSTSSQTDTNTSTVSSSTESVQASTKD